MRGIADVVQAVAATLWVGGLWVTGFVVAPVLFAVIPERALAGLVAGKLFSLMAWIGIACASGLLLCRLLRSGRRAWREGRLWLVVVMLLLVVVGECGVQPVMTSLREQAFPQPVMESLLRDRFALWHGVSSGLFLIQSVLGLVLVTLLGRDKSI